MTYPTKAEVEAADLETLCRWTRFLPSPTPQQVEVLNRIIDRQKEFGGWTPAISKSVGWERP